MEKLFPFLTIPLAVSGAVLSAFYFLNMSSYLCQMTSDVILNKERSLFFGRLFLAIKHLLIGDSFFSWRRLRTIGLLYLLVFVILAVEFGFTLLIPRDTMN